MDIKKLAEKINLKKMILPAALFLLGLILISTSGKEEEKETRTISFAMLSDELEERIEELCRSVDGVRTAKAFITLDTSEEYILANDTERNGDYIKIETVGGDSGGIELCVISPKIRGAAVVCTGGDRPAVKKKIVELVGAALGIDSSKIGVAGS